MADIRHFFEDQPLTGIRPMDNRAFFEAFGAVRSKRWDSFSRMVGDTADGTARPVQRAIEFKRNPSLHRCGARCLNATGFQCECSCLGKNHGAGNFVCVAA